MFYTLYIPGFISILFIALGTISLWTGITFINGTLWISKLSWVYEMVSLPWLRMIVILPIMGLGHLLFSLALKISPVVASPAGIIFTIIPPAVYALWLIHSYPTTRITIYIAILIIVALLLGFELSRLSHL